MLNSDSVCIIVIIAQSWMKMLELVYAVHATNILEQHNIMLIDLGLGRVAK